MCTLDSGADEIIKNEARSPSMSAQLYNPGIRTSDVPCGSPTGVDHCINKATELIPRIATRDKSCLARHYRTPSCRFAGARMSVELCSSYCRTSAPECPIPLRALLTSSRSEEDRRLSCSGGRNRIGRAMIHPLMMHRLALQNRATPLSALCGRTASLNIQSVFTWLDRVTVVLSHGYKPPLPPRE